MALVKGNPFIGFLSLQERMNQLFDEALSKQSGCSGLSGGAWSPPVDILETDDSIIISAELSGIDITDVDVEVEKNVLTLSGARKLDKCLSEEQFLRMECMYGAFQRVFSLPAVVSKDKVKASLKDGVLRVTLPKLNKQKPKPIKVEGD